MAKMRAWHLLKRRAYLFDINDTGPVEANLDVRRSRTANAFMEIDRH